MAKSLNTPAVLTQPIATNGTKNSIPATNDQSLGLMSQSTGFPPICSKRIADGGKAPRRADFNGAFNLLSQQHFFFQNGGTETFRQDVSDAIGGYPLNARLWYLNENGETYILRSKKENNKDNFLTNPSVIGDSWVYDVSTTSYVNSRINEIRTNCITEIPQDIKLELNNGTLTLKAGSKVYVPNGKNANGSNKFDAITMNVDAVLTQLWTSNDQVLIVYTPALGRLNLREPKDCCSGTTDTISGRFHFWYNTTNNLIKAIESSGAARAENLSFPLALITMAGDRTAKVNSIDQVFNGFGYIGSTVFCLPGVKGLIPDGRNADGSLKNFEAEISTVKVSANTGSGRDIFVIDKYNNINRMPLSAYKFDIENNKFINVSDGADRFYCICGTTTGDITSFNPKAPFRAVDYNDAVFNYGDQDIGGNKNFTGTLKAPTQTSATDNSTNVATTAWTNNFITNKKPEIAGWGMPNYSAGIDIAIRNNNETYTCPADGWVAITSFTHSNSYIGGCIYNQNTNVAVTFGGQYSSGGGIMPVCKDNVIVIKNKGNNQTIDYFRFYPRIGG